MSRYVFPSIVNPTKRFAVYDSFANNPGYSWRNSSVISDYLSTYDTLGDGETQHTPEYSPTNTFENAEELIMSAIPVLKQFSTEGSIFNNFYRMIVPWTHPSPKLLAFIGSLRYNPDKATYVNFDDQKKSTADSKRYDKRWKDVCSSYDGTVSAFRRGLYDAEITGGNCIHAVLRDFAIYQHLDKGIWTLASDLVNESGTVFRGVDDQRMETFIHVLSMLKVYLESRDQMERAHQSLQRSAFNFKSKQEQAVA
jgi:hypothetical protein